MAGLRRCVVSALFTMASMLPVWGQNYLTGPNTGAESRLDNTPRNVTFFLTVTGAGPYSLAGGIFYMKAGTSTTADVTLTVYNSLATPIGSVTLSNSTFCGGSDTPACQSYFYHSFKLSSPLTLSPDSYRLVLSTNAVPQQNSAYFVKGGGTNSSVVVPGGAAGSVELTPDLTVSKGSSPATFIAGVPATYGIQVTNIGSGASSGLITVTDTLDSNLTLVSATGVNWSCGAAGQSMTCTTTAAIPAGASAPPITLTVNVAQSSPTSVTNTVIVAGGGDTDTSNNFFQLVSPVSAPDLSLFKAATPTTFTQGQNGALYTITASNVGSAPSSGTITVTDTLDPNLTYVSATGSGWSCSAAGQIVTCTTSAAIGAGASSPPITLTVNVAAHGETSIANGVSVSGGSDVNPSNNSFQLVSNVVAPDLTVSKNCEPGSS